MLPGKGLGIEQAANRGMSGRLVDILADVTPYGFQKPGRSNWGDFCCRQIRKKPQRQIIMLLESHKVVRGFHHCVRISDKVKVFQTPPFLAARISVEVNHCEMTGPVVEALAQFGACYIEDTVAVELIRVF